MNDVCDERPMDTRSVVPSQDPDRARSRFIQAINRFLPGAWLQKRRLEAQSASAPRLLPGTEYEVVDLTGVPDNDLASTSTSLGRLQDAAREVITVFDRPVEVVAALAEFDGAIPRLREARNPLTHASDDSRLDDAAWLSAFMHLKPGGKVEYLVDPRFQHHDAAEALAETLLAYLRAGLRATA